VKCRKGVVYGGSGGAGIGVGGFRRGNEVIVALYSSREWDAKVEGE